MMRSIKMYMRINPFHATGLFRYPLKTSENQRSSDVFRWYRKRLVAWNGLKRSRGMEEAAKNLWVATLYCWGELEQTMRKVAQAIRTSSVQHIELGKYWCNKDFEDLDNILWLLWAIQSFWYKQLFVTKFNKWIGCKWICDKAELIGEELQKSIGNVSVDGAKLLLS